MDDLLTTAGSWLSGDTIRGRTKRTVIAAGAISVVAFFIGYRDLRTLAHPLTHAKPPASLPADDGSENKFGLPPKTRRAIFDEFAAAEPAGRAEGVRSFPGPALAWSAEDHRGAYERNKARELSGKYRCSLTQVYLALDEGIRERWPGPDGKPLDPKTVPLHPRRNYGF